MIQAVTISEFVGFWKINTDVYQAGYLQNYLDQFQDRFIRLIISADAWQEIDTTSITAKPKWNDLFNGVLYFNDACSLNVYQCGITEALKGLLYFAYVRDRMFDPTNSGNVQPLQEVSNRTANTHNGAIAAQRWNQAVSKLYDQVLMFVNNYEHVSEVITSSIDLGAGAYTINVSSTQYLSNAETVKVNGVEFTTSNVVTDASFDITGSTPGIDFTGGPAFWEPYKDFPLCHSLMSELQAIFL